MSDPRKDASDDVLEQGSRRPGRRPVIIAATAALVALAVLAVIRLGGDDRTDRTDRTDRAPVTAAPARTKTPWPTAKNACGADVELPLVRATPLGTPTGLQVSAGGPRLASVDVDSGRGETYTDLAGEHRWVTQLVPHGDDVYTLTAPCDGRPVGVLRSSGTGSVRTVDRGPVDGLIGGTAGVWGVHHPQDEGGRVELRGVVGRDLRLPWRMVPRGVAAGGIVAEGPDEDNLAAEQQTMYLLDPRTGRVDRKLGRGDVQAVGDDAVVWTGADCRFIPGEDTTPVPRRTCSLHVTSLTGDGRSVTYPLPDNRTPASPIVVSQDGRYVALQLSRPRHELHFANGHPWTPSEIAVLDLETKRLRTVPGLTVPAKTTAGIAFSPDARWLAITTNLGDRGELLVWRQGTRELLRTQVRIAGPLAYTIPVLVTG